MRNQHTDSAGDDQDGLPETAVRKLADGILLLKRAYNCAQELPACGDKLRSFVQSAFEEESWPEYIDDPLPHVGKGVPKRRPHDAIKLPKDCQTNHRIIRRQRGRLDVDIGWSETQKQNLPLFVISCFG